MTDKPTTIADVKAAIRGLTEPDLRELIDDLKSMDSGHWTYFANDLHRWVNSE